MIILAKIFTGIVALEHLFIFWIEAFAWEVKGPKVFSTLPASLFKETKGIAANMGLYNGFLAAGMIWSFFISDPMWSLNIATFFVGCVVVAAIYGGLTVDNGIVVKQGVPAFIAMAFLLLVR